MEKSSECRSLIKTIRPNADGCDLWMVGVQNPERRQNLSSYSLARYQHFLNISLPSVHNYTTVRQTDRQINASCQITSLVEVINMDFPRLCKCQSIQPQIYKASLINNYLSEINKRALSENGIRPDGFLSVIPKDWKPYKSVFLSALDGSRCLFSLHILLLQLGKKQ